jgi:hypothetical protein
VRDDEASPSNGDAKVLIGASSVGGSMVILSSDWREALFWWALERGMRSNQPSGREDRAWFTCVIGSFLANCAKGPSGCIDGAVDVTSDIAKSCPENVDGCSGCWVVSLDVSKGEGLRVRSMRW